MDAALEAEVVAHHLRLFGLDDPGLYGRDGARLELCAAADESSALSALSRATSGCTVVALSPGAAFCAALGAVTEAAPAAPPCELRASCERAAGPAALRTLHAVRTFRHPHGTPLIETRDAAPAWLWVPAGAGGILLVGTALAADLVRYRQGDPARALERPQEARWGIAGERPNYLFEPQLEGVAPLERHADWWALVLARSLAEKLGRELLPLLPDGAPGAVIVTGDDDQAYLEKYEEQLRLLGETPVTYFLHPLTRHTRESLKRMLRAPRVDLGLHPDALAEPARYGELLAGQSAWYRGLAGSPPLSVRNHGFLNDGYWGHLPAWLRENIRISSNLPGVDGRVLNGSLLPARLSRDGALTPHWSVLTVVGDGVRFALNMGETEAADCILRVADAVRRAQLPGVIVLNLHPQNVAETRSMHGAALEVIRGGFLPWTMRDCLEWFEARDAGVPVLRSGRTAGALQRVWRRVRAGLAS